MIFYRELTANVARVPAKKALSQLLRGPLDPDAIQYGANIQIYDKSLILANYTYKLDPGSRRDVSSHHQTQRKTFLFN